MSRFKIKKLPPIRLVDLLKKRRKNLKSFLSSYGIVSYSTLVQKCSSMGVSAPSEEEFKNTLGTAAEASSPQEGVVVLDPPALIKELTGEKISVDDKNNFEHQLAEVKVIINPEEQFSPSEQPLEDTTTRDDSTLQDVKFYKKKKSQSSKVEV
jgi:hypothetical protein